MTPQRQAYNAGREARAGGWIAADNPHDDWPLAVAWAAGWHHLELADLERPAGALEWQTREIVDLIFGLEA